MRACVCVCVCVCARARARMCVYCSTGTLPSVRKPDKSDVSDQFQLQLHPGYDACPAILPKNGLETGLNLGLHVRNNWKGMHVCTTSQSDGSMFGSQVLTDLTDTARQARRLLALVEICASQRRR
jgi:hypothetical protein